MNEKAGRHERAERILDALTASEDQEVAKDISDMEVQAQRYESIAKRGEPRGDQSLPREARSPHE